MMEPLYLSRTGFTIIVSTVIVFFFFFYKLIDRDLEFSDLDDVLVIPAFYKNSVVNH